VSADSSESDKIGISVGLKVLDGLNVSDGTNVCVGLKVG